MSNILLEVENLKTYFYTEQGVIKAVDGVSFGLREGEVLGIVGESGCGKSVTALSIMRLVPFPGNILEGGIYFQGKNLLALKKREMERIRGKEISMIFQEPIASLNPTYTIGNQIIETISFHQKLKKKKAKEKALNLLSQVGIPDPVHRINYYPHQLSGGMCQRVMIAIALACRPRILIADEPTSQLDVTIQIQIMDLLKRLKDELDMSIILITHNLSIVAEFSNNICIMYAGRIIEYGDTLQILKNPLHPYTKGLINSIPKIEEKPKRLATIPGGVPNPLVLPKGCKFNPRCAASQSSCKEEEPGLIEVNKGHLVRCFLYYCNIKMSSFL